MRSSGSGLKDAANADVICFGLTHKPYHKTLPDAENEPSPFRNAITIGSIGKPKDGDKRGCYVLLSIDVVLRRAKRMVSPWISSVLGMTWKKRQSS